MSQVLGAHGTPCATSTICALLESAGIQPRHWAPWSALPLSGGPSPGTSNAVFPNLLTEIRIVKLCAVLPREPGEDIVANALPEDTAGIPGGRGFVALGTRAEAVMSRERSTNRQTGSLDGSRRCPNRRTPLVDPHRLVDITVIQLGKPAALRLRNRYWHENRTCSMRKAGDRR